MLTGQIGRLLGPGGARTVTRLFAFLLPGIGVQILATGAQDVFQPVTAGHRLGFARPPHLDWWS